MLDPLDQRTVDDVDEHGWHCVQVGAGNEEPAFSYSVGFWETLDMPEIIVFVLGFKLMHSMLWEAFRQIRVGKVLADGARWSDLIEGFDCISRPVHPSQIRQYFGFATWYRGYRTGSSEISAYQLFWPGKVDGLYPWDIGSSEIVRECQPLLYLTRETGNA